MNINITCGKIKFKGKIDKCFAISLKIVEKAEEDMKYIQIKVRYIIIYECSSTVSPR